MTEKSPQLDALIRAITTGDLPTLQTLVQQGADLNAPYPYGPETLFSEALEHVCGLGGEPYRREHPPEVLQCIRWACQNGAALYLEPPSYARLMDECPSAILWNTLYAYDVEVMAVVLMCGYDPNWSTQFCMAEGLDDVPSPLSQAITHYEEPLHGITTLPPEPQARARNRSSTHFEWIEFLDWVARKQGLRRPDHLFLLHHFGARSADEYRRLIAEQPGWAPAPPAVCMAQALADCLVRQDLPAARSLLRAGADLNFVFHAPEHSAYPLTPVSLALLRSAQRDSERLCVTDVSGWLREVFAWGVQPNAAAICDGGLGLFEAAVRHLDPQLMDCLLELGCDLNAPRPPGGESLFDVAIRHYVDCVGGGAAAPRKTWPRTTAAEVLHFVGWDVLLGGEFDPPLSLQLLVKHGALLGTQLAAGTTVRCRSEGRTTLAPTADAMNVTPRSPAMSRSMPPQLVHFAFDQWVKEDADGLNLVVMDDEREAVDRRFTQLMAEQPTDSDGRYRDAAMKAAWAVATRGRPQIHRWVNNTDIATSCGHTTPADRCPPDRIPPTLQAQPRRLGVMWASDAGVAAVRQAVAAQPDAQPCFITPGKYFRTEAPARVVRQLADELTLPAWTLHCSGLEGPITLLARLHDLVMVLPVDRPQPEAEVWAAMSPTMRWLLWTAHGLGCPCTLVGSDGAEATWFCPSAPPAATVAEVQAAQTARHTFTAELKALDVEWVAGGSGVYLRERAVPLDLLDVPFDLVKRIAHWQEWGEALFHGPDAGDAPDAVRRDFQARGRSIAAQLGEALGGRVVVRYAERGEP